MPRRPAPWVLALAALFTAVSLLGGCAVPLFGDPAEAYNQNLSDAVAAFGQGNPGAANRALSRAAEAAALVSPTKSAAYRQVAQDLLDLGLPADAALFLRGATRDPELGWDPWLWATLADAWTKADDRAQARRAEAQAEASASAIMGTIRAGDTGRTEAARRFLQVGFYFHENRKDTPRALRAWREAVRRDPSNPEALNALGYTLADEGTTQEEFTEALALTRKALALSPGNPMILDSVGWALFKNGELAGARRVLRETVDEAPDVAELRYHLGVIYAQQGLTREAEIELNRALALKSDYPEAKRAKFLLRQPPGEGVVEGA